MFKKPFFILLIIFVYFFLFLFQREKAMMQDLGRHIKMGEIILSCRCVPKINLLSYTEPNHSFINHHWFSEVIFSVLYKIAGINLIIILKIFIISSVFLFLLYQTIPGASIFWLFLFSPLYIDIFSERFDSRPEIFSFLFFTLFLFIINKYRADKSLKMLLFILPVIEFIWVNTHIYFILGPLLLGILFIENLYEEKGKFDKTILISFLLSFAAVFLNPNFIKGALLPFNILNNYGYSIVENQNIFFLNLMIFDPKILIFEFVVFLLIIGLFLNIKKIRAFELLGTIFFTVTAFWQIRNFPLFVFFSFPVITMLYTNLDYKLAESFPSFLKSAKSFMLFLVFIFIFFTAKSEISSPLFGFSAINLYENGVNFMINNKIKGPIFNNFDIGSYLAFRLYPREKVFVDGRPEAYSVEFFNNYKRMQEDANFFNSQAENYKLNAIVVSATDITPWAKKFFNNIMKNKNWVVIYYDGKMVILVKNNLENKTLIDKFR